MNFLIVSGARCGSSTLQKSISNYYNLKTIFEPYAAWGNKRYAIDNVVVKTILHQIDNQEFILGNLPKSHFERCYDFHLSLIPKFDKIILLMRENVKEQAESLSNLYDGYVFNTKWVYRENTKIQPIIDQLCLENSYIEKLSESTGIPIDTYESIYYGNGLKDKSIGLDYTLLDNKNKLRQSVKSINKSLL